jgi:chemotaxis protein MotB
MSAAAGRRGRGGRGGGGEVENEERWLLTYSDMITLLMALFIVMWAISSVNISKFNQLKASLQSAFSARVLPANSSILSGQQSPFEQDGSPVQPLDPSSSASQAATSSSTSGQISSQISAPITQAAAQQDLDNLIRIKQQIEQYARAHGFAQLVSAKIDQRGLVVRLLTDNVLFSSGQAELNPQGFPILGEIAKALSQDAIVNPVRVEGNTDDVPIHSAQYPSNWELSTSRADAVLEFLLGHGIAPKRLSATGYGDVNPVASNGTPAGRASNRRVDIVILRRSFGSEGSSTP